MSHARFLGRFLGTQSQIIVEQEQSLSSVIIVAMLNYMVRGQ